MTLKEQEQYVLICKPQLERIETMLAVTNAGLLELNKRLFIGNGVEPLVGRVARIEDGHAVLRRVVWMCMGGAVSVLVAVVANMIING